jgi:hypothetical protein
MSLSLGDALQLAAGITGFASALLMSAPAILSIDSRGTMIKAARLKLTISDQESLSRQEAVLLGDALRELARERWYMRVGLGLLALSFALAIAGVLTGD